MLLKAARGEEYKDELAFVIDHYGDDFTSSSLTAQLEILTSAFASSTDCEKPTLTTIMECIVSFSPAQRISIPEVCTYCAQANYGDVSHHEHSASVL